MSDLLVTIGALGIITFYKYIGEALDMSYHKPVALLMAGVIGLILGYGAPELRPEKSAPNVSQ